MGVKGLNNKEMAELRCLENKLKIKKKLCPVAESRLKELRRRAIESHREEVGRLVLNQST